MGASDAGRDRWWRLLGWSFLLGALLDLPFGAAILVFQRLLAPALGVTLPQAGARVALDLDGLFLLALGAVYLLIFREPERFAPVAAVGTLLRFGGFALFYTDVITGRADRFYLTIGTLEAFLGLLHMFLLRMAAGSVVTALLRRERPR